MVPPFRYSAAFEDEVRRLHAGTEDLPGYDEYVRSHLGGPESRLGTFLTVTWPEIVHRLGDMHGKRVLDFGCGTGATTAGLMSVGLDVSAFDIDESSLELCRARLAEHGFPTERVYGADDFATVAGELGQFDFILMNGVIEHIPITTRGLREHVIRSALGALAPEGILYINETPNRWWPRDVHTTGMWLLPWLRAGSRVAYRQATRKGKHVERDRIAAGPRGLEERGLWGTTWRQLRRAIPAGYRIVNLEPGQDRRVAYTRPLSRRRRWFEHVVYRLVTRRFGIPVVAFTPMYSPLLVRRAGAGS